MSDKSLESNKFFAAILVACLVAMLTGFVAKKLVHPEKLEEDAVFVEGGAVEVVMADKPQLPEPILHLIATADVAKGQKLSKACAACHSFDQGGPNKVGPNLYDIVNSKLAHLDNFAYSDALMEKGGYWTYDDLNAFLWKPKVYAPGTKMNYLGLKRPQQRADIIAWLRTLAASPAALPTDADIAAEKARLDPDPVVEVVEDVVEGAVEAVESIEETIQDIAPEAGDTMNDIPNINDNIGGMSIPTEHNHTENAH